MRTIFTLLFVVLLLPDTVVAQSGKGKAKEKPKEAEKREAGFRVPIKVGHVAVSVEWAGEDLKEESDQLVVNVKVQNLSNSKLVEFETWGPHPKSSRVAILVDPAGNSYKGLAVRGSSFTLRGDDKTKPKPSDLTVPVYPKVTLEERLVFRTPVKGFKSIEITLPAANVGEEGELVFTVTALQVSKCVRPKPETVVAPKASPKAPAPVQPKHMPRTTPRQSPVPKPEEVEEAPVPRLAVVWNAMIAPKRVGNATFPVPGGTSAKAVDDYEYGSDVTK